MIGIYKITNPIGKIYIGQTIDTDRRFNHYKNLRCKEQPRLYRSLVKYGFENHTFEIVQECTINNLTILERFYQELYNTIGKNGLNCMLVKNNEFSGKHSEETKEKISNSLKGYKPSQKQIDRLIKYNKTRVLSEETRKKLGNGMRGKKHSDETKKKFSENRKGLKLSEETKIKMSNTAKSKCTDEWRKNISNKLKGRIITPEWREKLRIAAIKRHSKKN